MTESVRLNRDGAIASLVIDRPARRNALSLAMWQDIARLTAAAMDDAAVRVMVLRSATAGLFCAGADIDEMAAQAHDPAWGKSFQQAVRDAQYALALASKPVIAAIDGDAIGGGCGLAIACDIRIAVPEARLAITPAKLGLIYSLSDTKLLVDLIGRSRAARVLFAAELIDAGTALRIGLIDEIAEDAVAAAERLATTIAQRSPHSVRHAKAIIRRIVDGQQDDDAGTLALFADAMAGPDFAEGVSAFAEKRPPRFTS